MDLPETTKEEIPSFASNTKLYVNEVKQISIPNDNQLQQLTPNQDSSNQIQNQNQNQGTPKPQNEPIKYEQISDANIQNKAYKTFQPNPQRKMNEISIEHPNQQSQPNFMGNQPIPNQPNPNQNRYQPNQYQNPNPNPYQQPGQNFQGNYPGYGRYNPPQNQMNYYNNPQNFNQQPQMNNPNKMVGYNTAYNKNISNNMQNRPVPQEQNVKDQKVVKNYLDTCQNMLKEGIKYKESNRIKEALEKSEITKSKLKNIKQVILQTKTHLSSFLPEVDKMLNIADKLGNILIIEKYNTSSTRFKFPQKPDKMIPRDYMRHCLSIPPAVTFKDIFNETINIPKSLAEIWDGVQKINTKTVLLYGPKGCGKSLYPQALASHAQAKFIQIEGGDIFKIGGISSSTLGRSCVECQPIIVYCKNVEKYLPYELAVCSMIQKIIEIRDTRVLVISSTSKSPNKLPLKYHQTLSRFEIKVEPCKKKGEFIIFLGNALNIKVNLNPNEITQLNDELFFYSNEDLKNLLIEVYNSKKKTEDNGLEQIMIDYNDIQQGKQKVLPSLTKEILEEFKISI